MEARKYNWEMVGTREQFQKIFNGLDFMNNKPKDKLWKIIIRTDNVLEYLKVKWWLKYPPKKPKRTWYPERIPEKYREGGEKE